ncbi:kinase-like domain-containing protein [Rhizophagus irregularis DAOM 181602=DAOM 197198]|nr:kinase-like domain-containing protein [Rhizophagus irregularis DAOM 181602=DAOM 197198]
MPTGWINGRYDEWDSNERKLIRVGAIKVILKQLENVESADQSWFEEARSYLTISNKHSSIVQCFEEEQEAFHSKFSIPHNIDDFGESSNQYMSIIGKSDGIFKVLDGVQRMIIKMIIIKNVISMKMMMKDMIQIFVQRNKIPDDGI